MGHDQSKLKGLEIEKKAIEITDFWQLYSGEIVNYTNGGGGGGGGGGVSGTIGNGSILSSGATNGLGNQQLISIFQGEPIVNGQLWANQTPLERATKNFMIYRHPSILKYISSWEKGAIKYLATERCKPLLSCIAQQNNVQICLGLRNILCSLIFLLEQANVRHLNICSSSIYVTQLDGGWRMAGFEHLWKVKDVNASLLEKSQGYRYKKAIDLADARQTGIGLEQYAFGVLCEESLANIKDDTIPFVMDFKNYCTKHLRHPTREMRPKLSAILLHPYFNHDFILIHSFLCELTIKSSQDKQIFFQNLMKRLHTFDEEMIAIQLGNLLLSRMVLLDESAQFHVLPYLFKVKQIGEFNSTTSNNNNNTNNDNDLVDGGGGGGGVDDLEDQRNLFSIDIFRKYIIPKIIKIFLVRDAQIRLILLEYFKYYINYFTIDELTEDVLPQLLLGIKDTNDLLVAATLHCLADLIPILGSNIVVGKNRERLFADGRPTAISNQNGNGMVTNNEISSSSSRLYKTTSISSLTSSIISHQNLINNNTSNSSNSNQEWTQQSSVNNVPRSITPILKNCNHNLSSDDQIDISPSLSSTIMNLSINGGDTGSDQQFLNHDNNNNNNTVNELMMPERLSPDGGEDITTISIDGIDLEHDSNWSDWENDNLMGGNNSSSMNDDDDNLNNDNQEILPILNHSHNNNNNNSNKLIANDFIKDVKDIEITAKSIKSLAAVGGGGGSTTTTNEFDFFKDMEPIYQKPNILMITPNDDDVDDDDYDGNTDDGNRKDEGNTKNQLDNRKKFKQNRDGGKMESIIKIDKSRFEIKLPQQTDEEIIINGGDGDGGGGGGLDGWDDNVNDW